jgi:hypothetical protein
MWRVYGWSLIAILMIPGVSHALSSYYTRISLDAYDPGALCNDGSPGVAHVLIASPATRNWMVFLDGGGSCATDADCIARDYTDKTSNQPGITPQKRFSGILDDTNPNNPVRSMNIIRVHYCSSDVWVGQNAERNVTGVNPPIPSASYAPAPGYENKIRFSGATIAKAAFMAIAEIGASNPAVIPAGSVVIGNNSLILFAGTSAGGVGVINNLDSASLYLHSNKGVLVASFVGLLDAVDIRGQADAAGGTNGYIQTDAGANVSLLSYSEELLNYWTNNGAVPASLDVSCTNAYPTAKHTCMTDVVYGYLAREFFEAGNYYDNRAHLPYRSYRTSPTGMNQLQANAEWDIRSKSFSVRRTGAGEGGWYPDYYDPNFAPVNPGLHVLVTDALIFYAPSGVIAGFPPQSYYTTLGNWLGCKLSFPVVHACDSTTHSAP